MPRLESRLGERDQVPGVLRLGLHPRQVLERERDMADAVEQVGGLGQELARAELPPQLPVQLGLAGDARRRLGVSPVGGEHGEATVGLADEERALPLLRHSEDLVGAAPAQVVLAELGGARRPPAASRTPTHGEIRDEQQRLLDPLHRGRGLPPRELDEARPVDGDERRRGSRPELG